MPKESNSRPTDAFKHSAGILGKARPKALSELLQLTISGMEKKIDEEDFAFWMYEAADWKIAADKTWKAENTEWLYICCVNLVTLIYKKVLKHPELTNELSPSQIDILQTRGRNVLYGVAGLQKRVEDRYTQWQAAEQVRMQEYRREVVMLDTLLLHMEEGGDKTLPSVPEPERPLVDEFNFATMASAVMVATGWW